MSNPNDDKTTEETRPLGVVLGWLNLSSTVPNNQDSMASATAGFFNLKDLKLVFLLNLL